MKKPLRPDGLAEDLNKPPPVADRKAAEKKKHSALSPRAPQRRCDLPENHNAPSLAHKKPAKVPDSPAFRQTTFVGGFDPRLPAVNAKIDGHRPPLARLPVTNQNARPAAPPEATVAPSKQIETPIPMPVPQDAPTKPALTPSTVIISPRQHSDSIPSPEAGVKPPVSATTGPAEPALNAAPSRPRVVSSPSRPATASPGRYKARCSAMTKAKRQCLRQVKLPATHAHVDPMPVLYCHQHKISMLTQVGFYARGVPGPERFVKFDDYIFKYLQVDTQLALRVEMEKEKSPTDVPGYVYTFEIRDPERRDVIQLKVGRTTNLTKRLDQWDKQCGSKVQIPRGWWPGTVEDDDGTGRSLLKCNMKAGDPGPFCHRVERLVHIELSDLSLYEPYQHPDWPNSTSELPSGAGAAHPASKKPCLDCGAVHGEIFTFRRPEGGRFNGMEWDQIVRPVIKKWGEFVKEYYT